MLYIQLLIDKENYVTENTSTVVIFFMLENIFKFAVNI